METEGQGKSQDKNFSGKIRSELFEEVQQEMISSVPSDCEIEIEYLSQGTDPCNEADPVKERKERRNTPRIHIERSLKEDYETGTKAARRLSSSAVSKLLNRKKLSEGQELLLLMEARQVEVLDFPVLSSARGQLVALEKMDLNIVPWRRQLMARESVKMGPEKAPLKSYLLRYGQSFQVIDEIMRVSFEDDGRSGKERLLYCGDPDIGTIIRLHQLQPLRHGMDACTIEAHAAYQQKVLERLIQLDVRHIFYQEGWGAASTTEERYFRSTSSHARSFHSELRWCLAVFQEELPPDLTQIFPAGQPLSALSFKQKAILAYAGAEKLYAMLNHDVRIHSCMSRSDCEELTHMIGEGKEKGSASFASRFMLLKTVRRLEDFFLVNPGELAILSMNPAHEMGPADAERFARKPLQFIVEWPVLFNESEWKSPNAIRKVLANVEDPMKQERIVTLSRAVPLASYQHLRSGHVRKMALSKLVGDIAELRESDSETVKEFLLEHTPDQGLRRHIRRMAEEGTGIFRFLNASLDNPMDFWREKVTCSAAARKMVA